MRILSLTYLAGLLIVSLSSLYARDPFPSAAKGILDLREYNFKTGGPVELTGEFEFYWNQMLNPAIESDTGVVSYIQVPGSWYHLRRETPEITRYGFATYRLILLLPDGVNELSFKIEDVFSASGYFPNGKAIDYLGFPGVNKFQSELTPQTAVVGESWPE